MFGLADQAVDFVQRPPKFPPKIKKKVGAVGKSGIGPWAPRACAPQGPTVHTLAVWTADFSTAQASPAFIVILLKCNCITRHIQK
jgi:hypothetical protein